MGKVPVEDLLDTFKEMNLPRVILHKVDKDTVTTTVIKLDEVGAVYAYGESDG